ncbi:MAG: sigma-54-dependent Fis family transcriptional regulator [Crocinitomicaceae bacterium]|nr:sigma-54-dependent Fis family transcriptional regulator [Crocinitomicaceae bacterium]
MKKILIIDDDVDICTLISKFLERNGYDTHICYRGETGLKALKENAFDVVLTDFRLPDEDGLSLLSKIKEVDALVPVIIITGYSDVKQAVKVIQNGGFEYVTKPIFPEDILKLIERAVVERKKTTIQIENVTELAPLTHTKKSQQFIEGKSNSAKLLKQQIAMLAPTNISVVILGESGTGKEMVAKQIHSASKRFNQPFLAIDCGALPDELAASELFGHVKGSFTGAMLDKKGYFELANGGTLFLDEVGNLSYENQIKLLRVLQEKKIRRIGGDKDIEVDVRILAATNEDLKIAIENNQFREDLYYRLNEFSIEILPLRERKEDLLIFANYFLEAANQELNKNIEAINPSAMDALLNYNWPGNLRELKNIIKRSVLLSLSREISHNVLPSEITALQIPSKSIAKNELFNLKDVVEQAETDAIIRALNKVKNNKSKAAVLLGIDRKTLYNKLNAYQIDF